MSKVKRYQTSRRANVLATINSIISLLSGIFSFIAEEVVVGLCMGSLVTKILGFHHPHTLADKGGSKTIS
jgi:hypothetical protein